MILFTQPEFGAAAAVLANRAPNVRAGCFRSGRFANGELFMEVPTPVAGEKCAVLGTIAPPDEHLTSMLLLAHTLRRQGANEIIALLPYLGYSRQDKVKPGESLAGEWTGELLRVSGVNRVLTIDLHSQEDRRLFPIPLISISPAAVFAQAIRQRGLAGATIIAPDQGAVSRCDAIRDALELPRVPVPYFRKSRTDTGIQHLEFVGETGTEVILVDDILDTGATLVSACQRLLCAGVEDIEIMVTHGLFTGEAWKELWELGVTRIFTTDTIPHAGGCDRERIAVLPVVPLLKEDLER